MGGIDPDQEAWNANWGESDLDEAALVAALEAARRAQFAELAEL